MPTWNPVLFQPRSGPLVLFYKVGPSPREWWGMMTTSSDEGTTWSTPKRLPDRILGPIKNKPVQLADGAWLSPSSTEGVNESNTDHGPAEGGWLVHFELSRDAGKTWEIIGPVSKGAPKFDAIQPSILFHKKSDLQAVCRTKQGVIAQTWSKDGGKSWTALTAAELPNPNSGIDAVTWPIGANWSFIIIPHIGSTKPRGTVIRSMSRYLPTGWFGTASLPSKPSLVHPATPIPPLSKRPMEKFTSPTLGIANISSMR